MQLSQQTGHMLLFYQQCIALFLPIASGYQVSHLSDAISVDAKASTQKRIRNNYHRTGGKKKIAAKKNKSPGEDGIISEF